jgi:1,4-dihydroxy-6-naphthoate synthase
MKLRLAYSPCPNDTYAFHAMVHGLVDCEGLSFETHLTDVEELNKGAAATRFDVCKLSYHAFFLMHDKYVMLRSGSALGYGNGPLLVSPAGSRAFDNDGNPISGIIADNTVLIPGKNTTAALLLKIAFPKISRTRALLFSSIENELLEGKALSGILIHETRFTYLDKGLSLIADLGEQWQTISGLPIPLGGIAVSRELGRETALKIGRVLKRSILYAACNPQASGNYIRLHAQEMDPTVQEKHIQMFVNDYTTEIGETGEKAVNALFEHTLKIYPELKKSGNLFI